MLFSYNTGDLNISSNHLRTRTTTKILRVIAKKKNQYRPLKYHHESSGDYNVVIIRQSHGCERYETSLSHLQLNKSYACEVFYRHNYSEKCINKLTIIRCLNKESP